MRLFSRVFLYIGQLYHSTTQTFYTDTRGSIHQILQTISSLGDTDGNLTRQLGVPKLKWRRIVIAPDFLLDVFERFVHVQFLSVYWLPRLSWVIKRHAYSTTCVTPIAI